MKKYLVLPSNSDLNRGDQALIWNTVEIAQNSGFKGLFYMLANDKKNTHQSQEKGIKITSPILKHPSRKFKNNDNSKYGIKIKIMWGVVALFDLIKSLLLLFKPTARIGLFFLNENDKKTIDIFKSCDACFVKGGGFIHSYGKITDTYTIYYSLYHIALAQSMGKRVFVMPNSFGPFKSIGVKSLVKKVLDKCEIVAVRETISSEMLTEIDVKHNVFPDLGFFLEKNNKNFDEISELKNKYKGYKLVGMTARPYRFPESDNSDGLYENYIMELSNFSKWLFKNGYLPVFIDHTLSEKTHESDRIAIDKICMGIDEEEYAIISDVNYTCKDLKEIYGLLDYVIGTRFHSVIFALAEKTPAIAVTYGGNKGQGIMRDIDLMSYAIKINEVTFDELVRKFSLLVENSDEVIDKLVACEEKMLDEYNQLVKMLKNSGNDNG